VFVSGKGIVVDEPSVVTVQNDRRGERKIIAVGHEAKEMLGRTPDGAVAIRPIKDGVIADFEITEAMLRFFINRALGGKPIARPRIVICVPYGITEVEKRAVKESAQAAGAKGVYLVEEPMAAAIGAQLPVAEAAGSMIVDIGGGTTEVAVISLSGIVYSQSIRLGGNKMDVAIQNNVRRQHNLHIGENSAEQIKIEIGNAYPDGETRTFSVKGRDVIHGVPRTVEITSEEVREWLLEPVSRIVSAVRKSLEETPPELAADIVDKGIILAGGGAQLRNLDVLLREETRLPILVADEPLHCVVMGTGKVAEEIDLLKAVALL